MQSCYIAYQLSLLVHSKIAVPRWHISVRGRTTLARPVASSSHGDMSSAPHTRQCPYCELVFSYHSEVQDHVVHDHPEHAASVEGVEMRELPHN